MKPVALKRINKYEVVGIIGRGGMGVVYKAIDHSLERLVAIKMVTSADDEDGDLLKRFHREAQFTANLHHPNIVTVFDQGDFEGKPYLVMEYLAGQSLESMLARQPMSLQQRIGYIRQVCNGLQHAHSRQPRIVHRDIKPANIVVVENGTVKIVDFGIARLGESRHTRAGQLMGSYQYMSPEQITNADLDGRSDIFSAGVVLYQLLTLTLPFEGGGIANTLHRIINSPPPPLGQFLKQYPARLDAIITRALAKNPQDRYQMASEFGFDLLEVEDDINRGLFGNYLEHAENLLRHGEFEQARQELVQVLDIDCQHVRANELMREVQGANARLQRKDGARKLRIQAEQALKLDRTAEALSLLDQAVKLDDSDKELHRLREQTAEKQSRAEKLNEMLDRSERASANNDLAAALRAVDEALVFDPNSTRAKSFRAIVETKLAESERDRHVQNLLTSARRQIAQGKFPEGLELLKQAEKLNPTVSGLHNLIAAAESGHREELRQQALEKATAEISEALERADLSSARTLAAAAQEQFPNESGLLKLQAVVDQQNRREKETATLRTLLAAGRFDTADSQLLALRRELGDVPEVQQMEREIEAARVESTHRAVEKVVRDVQELVGLRDDTQAAALLESVVHLVPGVSPDLRERFEQLRGVLRQRSQQPAQHRIRREASQIFPSGRPNAQLHDRNVAELTPVDGIPFPGAGSASAPSDLTSNLSSWEVPATMPPKTGPAEDIDVFRRESVSAAEELPAVSPGESATPTPKGNSRWSEDILRSVEKELAVFIGPVANIVVKRAASRTTDPQEFYHLIAMSIEQRSDREALLARIDLISPSALKSASVQERQWSTNEGAETSVTSKSEFPPEEIERVKRLLARYVGPISGVLVKRAAPRVDNLRTLYKVLAQHVDTEPERTHFLREARFPDLEWLRLPTRRNALR